MTLCQQEGCTAPGDWTITSIPPDSKPGWHIGDDLATRHLCEQHAREVDAADIGWDDTPAPVEIVDLGDAVRVRVDGGEWELL